MFFTLCILLEFTNLLKKSRNYEVISCAGNFNKTEKKKKGILEYKFNIFTNFKISFTIPTSQ